MAGREAEASQLQDVGEIFCAVSHAVDVNQPTPRAYHCHRCSLTKAVFIRDQPQYELVTTCPILTGVPEYWLENQSMLLITLTDDKKAIHRFKYQKNWSHLRSSPAHHSLHTSTRNCTRSACPIKEPTKSENITY